MEQEMEELTPSPQQPEEPRNPRPRWQILMARIALAVFILMILVYYWNIASGGRVCGS